MVPYLTDTTASRETEPSLRSVDFRWAAKYPGPASFLLPAAITSVGALVAFFRIPAVSARTVWAEDGRVFLQEYLEEGPGLLSPYDGYLHLLPRLIVSITTPIFGLEAYALAVTVACSVVIGLVAASTFYCAAALSASITVRLCWASIPLLIAPGALETMGNCANLHWYLLWLMPWVLLRAPTALGQQLVLGGVALVITLSEIQSAIFLPLVFRQAKNRQLWLIKGPYLAGLACQFVSLWRFPRSRHGMEQGWDGLSVVYGYFLNSTAAISYGSSSTISSHIQAFGIIPVVLSAIPFAVAVILLAVLTKGIHRTAGCIWLFSSAAVWAAAVIINPAPYFNYSEHDAPDDWAGFFLSRYSTAPSMFLLALIPLLMTCTADSAPAATRIALMVRARPFRCCLAGAFLVLQTIHFFPVDAARHTGPIWSDGIKSAQLDCLGNPDMEHVRILQAPNGWDAEIPCVDLQSRK